MKLLPMDQLGPHGHASSYEFGILLPGIAPPAYRLQLRVIHEDDQFIQAEPPHVQPLTHSHDPLYGDYWSTTVELAAPGSGAHWGNGGRYVYRYCLTRPGGDELDWIVDPFAREFGVGRHAAFTYGYTGYTWSAGEAAWRAPRHHDLVMYELNIMEFAGTLARTIERLGYLQDLGVNCISLMPVTNISDAIDWGYTPIGYFGVDERFGRRCNFQELVDEAHRRGIAVLVDAIYGHTSSLFGYEYLYSHTDVPNPIMGSFSSDMFGPSVDWSKTFAEDFFFSVNRHWLEVYHVDGFRYDCVPNYWAPPHHRGYGALARATHRHVKQQVAIGDPRYVRFDDGGRPVRLVQCAEQLEAVEAVLAQTHSTCAWQGWTRAAACAVAHAHDGALERLGLTLGAAGLPTAANLDGDQLHKAPLQYIENHDQDRFICSFGTRNPDSGGNPLFEQGDRDRWYRVQPYLIGLLMSKGIPLLWQGQELCENARVAPGGTSRTGFLRIVHWEYFYDAPGRGLLTLTRALLDLRRRLTHVRDGAHHFFNHAERYQDNGVLLFARYYPDTPHYTLVALNFTGGEREVPFWFPIAGDYREELHGAHDPALNLSNVQAYSQRTLELPGNYGRIWTHA